MRRRTQLEMFSTQDFAQENADLKARLQRWEEAFERMAEERDQALEASVHFRTQGEALQDTTKRLERELDYARTENRVLTALLEAWKRERRPSGGPSRDELTTLLTLAHPDKWSQGQAATELAHELSVLINQLRAQA